MYIFILYEIGMMVHFVDKSTYNTDCIVSFLYFWAHAFFLQVSKIFIGF